MAFAAASAIAAALLASGYLSRREAALSRMSSPTPVVVTTRDVASGDTLEANSLSVRALPASAVPADAIGSVESAVGRIAMVPLSEGSQVLRSSARAPWSIGGLSAQVPAGMRAWSIGLSRSRAAGGLMRPGDSVDVIAALDAGDGGRAQRTTVSLVRGARVLAVGPSMVGQPERAAGGDGLLAGLARRPSADELVVTLALTPEEARLLALAQSAGAVSLALMPPGGFEDEDGGGPTTMSGSLGGDMLFSPRKRFREYKGR